MSHCHGCYELHGGSSRGGRKEILILGFMCLKTNLQNLKQQLKDSAGTDECAAAEDHICASPSAVARKESLHARLQFL